MFSFLQIELEFRSRVARSVTQSKAKMQIYLGDYDLGPYWARSTIMGAYHHVTHSRASHNSRA